MTLYHIYKNESGKYEQCLVKHGDYISGTRQGYSNKKAAIHTINIAAEAANRVGPVLFQDDCGKKPVICSLYANGKVIKHPDRKVNEKYVPK